MILLYIFFEVLSLHTECKMHQNRIKNTAHKHAYLCFYTPYIRMWDLIWVPEIVVVACSCQLFLYRRVHTFHNVAAGTFAKKYIKKNQSSRQLLKGQRYYCSLGRVAGWPASANTWNHESVSSIHVWDETARKLRWPPGNTLCRCPLSWVSVSNRPS